jgi:hypothetical protein
MTSGGSIMNPFFARCATVAALVAFGFLAATSGAVHAVVGAVTQTLNVAVLEPCCGNPVPGASGVAQSNTLVKAGSSQVDIFSSSITLPSQSLVGGSNSNSSADIRLVLSRGGVKYAECFLVPVFHEDNNNEPNTKTFLVNIVKVVFNSGTIFKQLAGQCDVDLATDGIQAGVPSVQTGDVATAVSVVSSVPTDFLSGTFVQP